MFSSISTLCIFALAVFAAATPTPDTVVARGGGSQCDTGPIQCCKTVEKSSNSGVEGILSTLGLPLGDVTGLIGYNCSPLEVIGVGSGTSCKAQPVCCENNIYNGLINIGCSPISL